MTHPTNKQPVPAPDGVPACFGVQFDDRDRVCAQACEWRNECRPRSRAWEKQRSLAELCAEAREALAAKVDVEITETLEQIYDRLHHEIFGKRATRRSTEKNDELFARLFGYLLREEIDPETYVAGNMWAMKVWVKANPKIGFQPTHLSGEKALRRYFAYRNHQSRRFGQRRHTGATSGTERENVRQQLYAGEYAVAEEYVRAFLDGEDDWGAAIRRARPNADWMAVETVGQASPPRRRYHELCVVLGTLKLREEKKLAQLHAACSIAELYRSDLSHRIGVRGLFRWDAFATLLARLFPLPARESDRLSLEDVAGVAWG